MSGNFNFQQNISEKAKRFLEELNNKSLEREEMSKLIVLAFLASKHMFLIGKPGVGKTFLISKLKNVLQEAEIFEYLLAYDTKPEELYGYNFVDDNGRVQHNTEKSIIGANLLVLDEMFKASSGLLNNMLGALSQNRNFFLRGVGEIKLPLISAFVLSNEFPQDDILDPFDDRLHFRYEVVRLQKDESFKKMILKDYDTSSEFTVSFTVEEIVKCKEEFSNIVIPEDVLNFFVLLKNSIVRNELRISDRKLDDAVNIFQASAYLNGRFEVNYSDVFLMMHLSWRDFTERRKLRQILFETFFQKKESIVKEFNAQKEYLQDIKNYCVGNVDAFIEEKIIFDLESNVDRLEYNKYVDYYISVLEALRDLKERIDISIKNYDFTLYVENELEENIFMNNFKNNVFSDEYIQEFSKFIQNFEEIYDNYFKYISTKASKLHLYKNEGDK